MTNNTPRLRSVDFLTPEQLKRKRETDRKSQREIRARTRAHIEELQSKVSGLEKENRALERERLILQSQCFCHRDQNTNSRRAYSLPQQDNSTMVTTTSVSSQSGMNVGWEQSALVVSSVPDVSITHTSLDSMSWASIIEYATLGPTSLPLDNNYSTYSVASPNSDYCLLSTPACTQVWAALPNIIPPTCPLDKVLVDLVKNRRACEEGGGNVQEFQKRRFPSVQSLLNPEHEPEKSPVTSAIVKNIIHIMVMPNLPEQIAVLYVMSSVVRWQISPTEANYDSLPTWLRPTSAQLVNSHPAWTDVFPWPRARERICRYPEYQDQNAKFTKICNATLSINWPYEASDMLVQISETDSILNPIFERHIRDLRNWTLGKEFVEAYPAFVNDVNLGPPRRD